MKLSKTVYFPDKPTKKQWRSLTIDELVTIAKQARSIKNPFKEALVNYLFEIGLMRH